MGSTAWRRRPGRRPPSSSAANAGRAALRARSGRDRFSSCRVSQFMPIKKFIDVKILSCNSDSRQGSCVRPAIRRRRRGFWIDPKIESPWNYLTPGRRSEHAFMTRQDTARRMEGRTAAKQAEASDLPLRDRKKVRQRTEFLRIALELFRQEGFEKTRMEDIAARALVSTPTVYNYFAS